VWLVEPPDYAPQGPLGADWSSTDLGGNNERSDLEANVTRNLSPHHTFRKGVDYKSLFPRTVRRLALDSTALISPNRNSWAAQRNVPPANTDTFRPTPATFVSNGII